MYFANNSIFEEFEQYVYRFGVMLVGSSKDVVIPMSDLAKLLGFGGSDIDSIDGWQHF